MAYTTPEYLHGLPQDYDILPGGIPRNRKTGEMGRANNTNGYTFVDLKWLIVNGKLALQSPLPGASGFTQADLDKARADALAAARAALAGVR